MINKLVRNSNGAIFAATALWLLLVWAGLATLNSYSNSAGAAAADVKTYPEDWHGSIDGYRLEMFVHPRCPCTRASIRQLARMMTRCHGRLAGRVHAFCPSGKPLSWAQTDLWYSAERIPGVKVQIDYDGAMAARYGVQTSGQVMLFNAAGVLRFSGGITSARGHEGDCFGTDAIISLVKGDKSGEHHAPVFGCPLTRSEEMDSHADQ